MSSETVPASPPSQELVPTNCDEPAPGKPLVWAETIDGDLLEIEREVALLSPVLAVQALRGAGTQQSPLQLPKQVLPDVLKLILAYCRFHKQAGRSDLERKLFDEKYIRQLDTRRLCELTSAADSLDVTPLVDLTSRGLARLIEGKTPEEIRDTFHLPDDLTEEEKLEPVTNIKDDPRIRLLNRLYAKKRQDLQQRRAVTHGEPGSVSQQEKQDGRSVDELLQFIESKADGGDGKGGKGKKKKGKKKGAGGQDQHDGSGGEEASPTDSPAPEYATGRGGRSGSGAASSDAAAAHVSSERAARAARRRAAAAAAGADSESEDNAHSAPADAAASHGRGGLSEEELLMLDAELFALLDREIGSQWGAASRHEAALAPARSERIASGGSAGAGPLSEELKALAASAEALVQIQAGLSREALPESAAAKVQGMMHMQLRLASQLHELAERLKLGEARGAAGGAGSAPSSPLVSSAAAGSGGRGRRKQQQQGSGAAIAGEPSEEGDDDGRGR